MDYHTYSAISQAIFTQILTELGQFEAVEGVSAYTQVFLFFVSNLLHSFYCFEYNFSIVFLRKFHAR